MEALNENINTVEEFSEDILSEDVDDYDTEDYDDEYDDLSEDISDENLDLDSDLDEFAEESELDEYVRVKNTDSISLESEDTEDTEDTEDMAIKGNNTESVSFDAEDTEDLSEDTIEDMVTDVTATGEDKVFDLLKITSDKFSLETKVIPIREIGLTEPAKKGRERTVIGLSKSIKDMGVLTPIHVMKVPDADASEDYRYVLIDGLRRMFGAIKNGMTTIPAVVWRFKDSERGMELILPLSLMLDRGQKHEWSEVWDLYRILELQSAITPNMLEYLLQLEAGDAMRLKDVMLCDYPEIKATLLSGEKNLDACYKMLQKARKEEDQLGKDDATGFGDTVDGAEEVTDDMTGSKQQLSDADVMELLEMADDMDSDDSEPSSFDAMANPDDAFVDQQKVGDRHPLDPALRQAVLARDDFTCQCCGMRMVGVRLGLAAVHHVIPVHCSGKDTLPNLKTLCVGCHITLHVIERNGGTIMMSKEDYNALLPSEKSSLNRAYKLAKIAIEADKRKGMTKEQIMEATKSSTKHPMPGVGLKETQAMYNATVNSRSMD